MGELIRLRPRRSVAVRAATQVTFFFDLACPYTYLAAERLDRRFPGAEWRPASARRLALSPVAGPEPDERAMRVAERRAQELHLPLIWPERFPAPVPAAMRAATYAASSGRGPAFAIAVGRLAFCGGFDVEDPRILAEAAAAAGLDVRATLAAAADARRDRHVEAAGRALWVHGGTELPAVAHGGGIFCGEMRVTAAMYWAPVAASGDRR